MAPLWLLLVGPRGGPPALAPHPGAMGLLWSLLGILVVVDSLDGALHVPDRWFGLILLAEGVSSLAVGPSHSGAARRLRLFKGGLLTIMAVLILMATRHSTFLLAMIFGIAFMVDGVDPDHDRGPAEVRRLADRPWRWARSASPSACSISSRGRRGTPARWATASGCS